jgi:RNA polymerase sigma-54 factor
MQRLDLKQLLSQRLSPQQIQFIKLLQIPTAELETRIKEEMETNPALEEGDSEDADAERDENSDDTPEADDPNDSLDSDDNTLDEDFSSGEPSDDSGSADEYDYADERPDPTPTADEEGPSLDKDSGDLDISDYINDDEIAGYKMQGDGPGDEEERDMPLADTSGSLQDSLLDQLHFAQLDDLQQAIGEQLIGSIDGDGYIRRDLAAIEATEAEIENVLRVIQQFDPPGIAARDLPECLMLQLERRPQDEATRNAERILTETFEEFTKKHYQRIQQKLDLEDDELKDAVAVILKLNPKPGGSGPVSGGRGSAGGAQYLMPDFILTNDNGELNLTLNARNAPELRVSRDYREMLQTYDKASKKDQKMKEAVTFVKQKLDSAKWFIDAIRQRQNTLLRTMSAIVERQREFFLTGDDSKLRPMILKDIAQAIGMDISTVSRVANSKSIQTEHGIYPLKFFFSEGIATDSGEDASSREVKSILRDLIGNEKKDHPLSDDKLEKMLNARGYNIARRTVAKYREQLNIPVARLRKEL